MSTFFADFAATGSILGCGLDTTPEQWQEAVGNDFVDDRRKKQLRRDYGLFEVSFVRVEGAWEGFSISVQAHRLGWKGQNVQEIVPERLRLRYPEIPERYAVRDLIKELGKAGVASEKPERYGDLWIPSASVTVYATDPSMLDPGSAIHEGDIWSLIRHTGA